VRPKLTLKPTRDGVKASLIEDDPESFPLTSSNAAARLASAPERTLFSLSEIARAFALTPQELHAELLAGRLLACGVPNDTGGFSNVAVNGTELVRWMALTGRTLGPKP
jgi:hypothetical protein